MQFLAIFNGKMRILDFYSIEKPIESQNQCKYEQFTLSAKDQAGKFGEI